MTGPLEPWYPAQERAELPARWILWHQGQICLHGTGTWPEQAPEATAHHTVLGHDTQHNWHTAELLAAPNTMQTLPLRQALMHPPPGWKAQDLLRLTQAQALLAHTRDHHHCGRCGQHMQAHHQDWSRTCAQCQHRIYPRIDPVVMVRVTRDEQILLLEHQRSPGRFGLVAGFLEPGETAEAAAQREVAEETGLHIELGPALGTQFWPFSSQLLLAYAAQAQAGALHLQTSEILSARWCSSTDITQETVVIPPTISIAGQLIRQWCQQESSTG